MEFATLTLNAKTNRPIFHILTSDELAVHVAKAKEVFFLSPLSYYIGFCVNGLPTGLSPEMFFLLLFFCLPFLYPFLFQLHEKEEKEKEKKKERDSAMKE